MTRKYTEARQEGGRGGLTKLFYSSLCLIVKAKIVSRKSEGPFWSISPISIAFVQRSECQFYGRYMDCTEGSSLVGRGVLGWRFRSWLLDMMFRRHWCCSLMLRVVGKDIVKRAGVDCFVVLRWQSLFRFLHPVTKFRSFSLTH